MSLSHSCSGLMIQSCINLFTLSTQGRVFCYSNRNELRQALALVLSHVQPVKTRGSTASVCVCVCLCVCVPKKRPTHWENSGRCLPPLSITDPIPRSFHQLQREAPGSRTCPKEARQQQEIPIRPPTVQLIHSDFLRLLRRLGWAAIHQPKLTLPPTSRENRASKRQSLRSSK